jgi:hypothetical protein
MIETWKESQLQQLAIGHEIRRREIDSSLDLEEFPQPAASQVALLQVFTDVLEEKQTPVAAVKLISDWVLSVQDSDICYDVSRAYRGVLAVLFSGARTFSSRKHLRILADITVELANLPDLYNNNDEPIKFEQDGISIVVQPGERVKVPCFTGGGLWSGLPDFASYIGADLYGGPMQYLSSAETGHGDQQQKLREAEDKYTNINTFAALIAQKRPPLDSQLGSCVHNSFAVFAFLEHGPDTPYGKHAHLVARAAAAWLTIAGDEVVAAGSPTTKHSYTPGSLWEARGGGDTVDVKRLRFWKDRFQKIRESTSLSSQEALDVTNEAVAALDRLIAERI